MPQLHSHSALFSLWSVPSGRYAGTHSLQHQITSHAISLTILWPEYLAWVSASSLNLPSTFSPYSSICWWKWDSCVLRSLLVQTLQIFFHKFQSNFFLFHIHRQCLSKEPKRIHTSNHRLPQSIFVSWHQTDKKVLITIFSRVTLGFCWISNWLKLHLFVLII